MEEEFAVTVTPTWVAVTQMLLTIIEHSKNEQSRADARNELIRMAGILDRYVAAQSSEDSE